MGGVTMKIRAKRSERMSSLRSTATKLTSAQRTTLLFGVVPDESVFASKEDMREAWVMHRDDLMSSVNPCTRPSGWWIFEGPDGKDHHEPEALRLLIECGELSDSEAAHRRKLGRELSKNYWQPEHEAAWQERQAREGNNA